jgi:hypothetical protein
VKLSRDGLTLWYGTPDAPAPQDEIVSRNGASLVVGVHPPNPTNAVQVRYRVDKGVAQVAPGRELRTDYEREAQYFHVAFPNFPTGKVVEYCPIFSCGGRQVPAPPATDRFPSKFFLAANETRPTETTARRSSPLGQQVAPEVEFLAGITVQVDKPLVVGETPEGVRIDFFVLDGTVVGPKFNGRVLPRSSDHLFVRPDGIGVIRVRAVIVLDDGAMLEIEDTGSVDFGADGYQRALANNLPSHSDLVICPRVLTGHPKYLWLNRIQFLGVGRTSLDQLSLHYDLHAVRCRTMVPTS